MRVTDVSGNLAARLPASFIEKLADHVRPLQGPSHLGLSQAKDLVANPVYRSACEDLWEAWKEDANVPGVAVAAALEAAGTAVASLRARMSVDLVVTGPNSYHVPLRQTTAVMLELINGASESLWLVSFAAYKVASVAAALASAVDRGVSLRLLLETTEAGLKFDAAPAFAKVADQAAFYRWPLDKRPPLDNGHASMHAKALVADRSRALVTSANFTGRALDDNMEIGVLVTGGELPQALATHLESLVEKKILQRVQ